MIAGVVLTYHPTAEVVQNVLEILKQVERVYLVNNEHSSATEVVLSELSRLPNVKFINFDQNQGVAAGFNAGVKRAIDDGFQYVVLFDQDSSPDGGMVSKLLCAYEAKKPSVGVVGPKLRDRETGRFFDSEVGVMARDLLISSGSLISKELISEVGLFEESYFIDYVDHEYCLRVKAAGKTNFIVNDATLGHQFGNPSKRFFWGREIIVSNYTPFRHYHMARNRIFLLRKYGLDRWFWKDLSHMLKMWAKVLLFEQNKLKKHVAFARGLRDGLSDFPRR